MDILDNLKIAQELQRSEHRYKTLIEEASDAIIITDEQGMLIEANPSFCKMLGYTEHELIGMALKDLMDPQNLINDPLRLDVLRNGKPIYRERVMRTRSGVAVPIEEHVKMLQDRRILAIVRDITERKQIEQALRKSEDHIRLIINTIPAMAWTVTPDGTVDFANKPWMDYAGNAQYNEPDTIIHPEDAAKAIDKWKDSMGKHEPYESEMRLRSGDGKYRWFQIRTAPLFDEHGVLKKWYGVALDIDNAKTAQDQLQFAYQSLSYHVNNTPLAIIEADDNLHIKRWSRRAEEMFGWTEEEAVGQRLFGTDFRFVYDEDETSVYKVADALRMGLLDRNVNVSRNYTKEGKVIFCEWYNSVLRDAEGNVVTVLSLIHDVTERERAGEHLKQSYEEIKRLTEHLQNIREEERTNIAREIHDELGGQLTVLKMDASWLNQKLTTESKTVRQRLRNLITLLDMMMKAVRRISSELRPSLLDSLGLVAAMEWHLKEFEKRSKIKTTFIKPNDELEIPDQVKNGLFRIFQESLTNVARHSRAKKVEVELTQTSQQYFLRITDDGHGFDSAKISKEKTLGILGMRERTATMGGKYVINSKVGTGTTVTVELPLEKIK